MSCCLRESVSLLGGVLSGHVPLVSVLICSTKLGRSEGYTVYVRHVSLTL